MVNRYIKNCFTAALTLLLTVSVDAATRTWTGAGAGGAGKDFNDPSNWTGSGALLTIDDLIITMTSADTITLSSSVTVNSLVFTVNIGSGTSYGVLDAGGNVLTINGTTSFIPQNYVAFTSWDICELDATGTGGGFVFNSTVDFATSGNGDVHFEADISNPGTLTFNGDVNFGNYVYTTPDDEPNFVFDGSGTQTINCSQVTSYTMGESITFGVTNSPTVNFTNNSWRIQCYENNVTIGANTTVDLVFGGLDNYLGGGTSTFTMAAGSELRLGSTADFPGDDIFNDYNTYTLDVTSTVEYYGTNQSIKGTNVAYGNLELTGSGTKTSNSSFSVAGNFTNDVTFAHGNDTHTFNGSSDQSINGAASSTSFYTFVVNKSGGTLTSDMDLSMDNSLQMDQGTFLVDGETVLANNLIDINGGTLQITSGTITMDEDSDTDFDQDGGTFDIDGGTVNIGLVASQSNTDYNLDAGTLDISNGTLNIADEFDMDGGNLVQSGGTINVKAHSGSDDGTAASKFDVSAGVVSISNGDIYLLGAYDSSPTYPALNFTGGTINITGGTITCSETGSNDESYYLSPNGVAINNLVVNKTTAGTTTQTIWLEDFEDLSSGIETDNGATAWSTACTGASPCGLFDSATNDYFNTTNFSYINGSNEFTGRDMDNEAVWTSESITISGYSNVSVSIELAESGYDDSNDYIRCYYSLDGGAQTLLTNGSQSGSFTAATASVSGLSGSTIQVFVYMVNNGRHDYGLFDDIHVQGDISANATQVYLSNETDIDGNLTISNGTLDLSTGNSALRVAGNWVNNGEFNEQSGSVTFDGGLTQSLSSGGTSERFYNLTVNNSDATGIQLNDDIEISNLMTFTDGVVSPVAGEIVNILLNATVSGASDNSYVDGQVRKTGNNAGNFPFSFPVGDGGNYQAITISAPSVSTDHFTAQYFLTAAHPTYNETSLDGTLDHVSGCEYWILNRTNGSSDIEVSLSWDTNSCGVTDLCDLSVAQWNGAMWIDEGNGGTSGTTGSGSVVSGSACSSTANVGGFGAFTLASISTQNPLPVELISFDAIANGLKVDLSWITASEVDNDYFTVERSADGINFEPILYQNGQGNSSVMTRYTDQDLYPLSGISYYRLKQTDFDESFSYSNVVEVSFENLEPIMVYPNPTLGRITIRHDIELQQEIYIYNSLGQDVTKLSGLEHTSPKSATADLSGLRSGLYFIIIGKTTKKVYMAN